MKKMPCRRNAFGAIAVGSALKTVVTLFVIPAFVLVSSGSMAQHKAPLPAAKIELRAPPQPVKQPATNTALPVTTKKPPEFQKTKSLPLAVQKRKERTFFVDEDEIGTIRKDVVTPKPSRSCPTCKPLEN